MRRDAMHTSIFSNAKRSRTVLGTAVLAAMLTLPGCTDQQLQSNSPAYLIIDALQAASGAQPTKFSGTLASDVITIVKNNPTVFEDYAQVRLRLALKDPGPITSPSEPSTTNEITVTRYHVRFIRSDGRNTQGVDVPYEFDGGATGTVTATGTTMTFTLVRVQSKFEAPLVALAGGGGPGSISTIAEVTLYGTDQAGRVVSVKGLIGVNFADWGDPAEG